LGLNIFLSTVFLNTLSVYSFIPTKCTLHTLLWHTAALICHLQAGRAKA
jgi:hypothetical protein